MLRGAPTGIAANSIKGNSLHSPLKLLVQTQFTDHGSKKLLELQKIFRHIKDVVIDEKSMINLKIIHLVGRRLRQITAQNEWFGGISVIYPLILFGDNHQLLLVSGKSLFSSYTSNKEEADGRAAYMQFTTTVELT